MFTPQVQMFFYAKEEIFLSKLEKIEYIIERLKESDGYVIDEIFEFLQEVEY